MKNKKRSYILLGVQIICLILAAALLARPGYRYGRRLYQEFRDRTFWEEWKRKSSHTNHTGDPWAWLTVQAADIDKLVRWNDSPQNLLLGPCLLESPGPLRVISAHRDLDFRGLEAVSVGDTIKLEFPASPCRNYRVREIEVLTPEVAARRLREKHEEDWLVLFTCYPFRYIGPAPRRFLAWARAE